jgi:small multidrug resistance pump
MYVYIILFFAIAFEVLGTLLLPVSQNFTKVVPTAILLISYIISIFLLAYLSTKLPLSIIYASWAGLGIFSVTLLSLFLYKQLLNWQIFVGLSLIILGVVLVSIYK